MSLFCRTRITVLHAGIAAAVLGLSALSATAGAPQDSYASSASGQQAPAGSDAALLERVKKALHSDSALDDRHIKVAVESGNVVLKGFVQDNRALIAAGQAATQAAGDHKVVNNLTIKQNYGTQPD